MPKTYVGNTSNIGKGLFAKKNIRKDEVIFIVKGKIKKGPYSRKFFKTGPNWLSIEEKKWLSPSNNCPWRYINHSCNPNVGLKGKVTVVAMKNIKESEQLMIDYSITENDPYWKMKCMCGQKNCRKIIRSYRYLSPKLKNKYKKYIPNFLKTI